MRFFYQSLLMILLILTNQSFASALKDKAFLKADKIYYDSNESVFTAEGNVMITMGNYVLTSKELEYDKKNDLIIAKKGVKITDNSGRDIYGEHVVLKNKFKQGVIDNFVAKLKNDVIFISKQAKRTSEDQFELQDSIFTSCKILCSSKPIWQIKSGNTKIDHKKKEITYRNAFFEVYGFPILYIPYFTHPSPDNNGQSGILLPKFKKNHWILPFYLRIKPNIDFTIKPQFYHQHVILGLEYRHKLKNGSYEIQTNFGNPRDTILDANQQPQIIKNRFHLFSKGDFKIDDSFSLGFDLDIASDKSYLTNYYHIYEPYLVSNIYAQHVTDRNYISVEYTGFQEMRNGYNDTNSFIAPLINTNHIFSLNPSESALFNIKTNSLIYTRPNEVTLLKSSLSLGFEGDYKSHNGLALDYYIANKSDFYLYGLEDNVNAEHGSFMNNTQKIGLKLGYPLVNKYLKLEPIINCIFSNKFNNKQINSNYIETYQEDFSTANLFSSDPINVINNAHNKLNLSYGFNASFGLGDLFVTSFLGKSYRSINHNIQDIGYVGNISVDLNHHFSLLYNFHKDKNLTSIRDELTIAGDNGIFKTQLDFIHLNKISEYYPNQFSLIGQNRISQLNLSVDYEFKKRLWIGGSVRANLHPTKFESLDRTIQMTYLFDCVKLGFKISENFLEDVNRGIKNHRSRSFILELKALNM